MTAMLLLVGFPRMTLPRKAVEVSKAIGVAETAPDGRPALTLLLAVTVQL